MYIVLVLIIFNSARESIMRRLNTILLFFFFLLFSTSVLAASTGMPWENPLDYILRSLHGKVAVGISMLSLAVFAIGLMHGETGGWIKRGLVIGLGISILANIGVILSNVFKMGQGLTF